MDRLPLHGTVTLANGEKLSDCSITFLPAKGHAGPAATIKVDEGSYQFDRSNGPAAGPHTVIVRKIVRRSSPPASRKTKTEWTQSADLTDDGQYLHDIILKD